MTPENGRFDPALEQAVSEIRNESLQDHVIKAAASRVWHRLSEAAAETGHLEHIGDCEAFRALFARLRAGSLPEAQTLLVRDHLHECVACRRIFEGKVVALPVAPIARTNHRARWAVAAGVVAAGGLVVWFSVLQYGGSGGHAMVESIHGTLYEVAPAGLRVMAAGQALPDGMEVRTGRDSSAVLRLRDGSRVEARERSELATAQSGADLTLHLDRGSVIVQAAKWRSGHLYLATADCRVAVTGTVFSVSAGVKGSRVSVVEGEVNVTRDNRETVLHRGGQFSTSETLDPRPVPDDFSWTHNERLRLQLPSLERGLAPFPLETVRYSSRLLGLLPAATVFYASIPNLGEYFAAAERFFHDKAAENPELRAWLDGPGASIEPMLGRLRAANEYLGDEIVVFGTARTGPVFLSEVKRPGFQEFLRKAGLPQAVEAQPGIVMLNPNPGSPLPQLDATFIKTAFYARIREAYHRGTGLLWCADTMYLPKPLHQAHIEADIAEFPGRYLVAAQSRVGEHMETRAEISFDGPRTGIGAWLASPSPLGALDYVTHEATALAAFAVAHPQAVVDELAGSGSAPAAVSAQRELAASLGGEVALALDGPPLPVPSWKLVAEVYDPERFEDAIEKWAAAYNQQTEAASKQIHISREVTGGRTFYALTWGEATPLTQAHYIFASGYLIAAPTLALLTRALQARASGDSIARSPSFTALLPHDPYANFSAVLFQNLGATLAPFAGLLDPKAAAGVAKLKPFLVAAYGEPDRITLASTGDLLGMGFHSFLTGSLLGIARDSLPMPQLFGTSREGIPSR
ncbi:MAG: FecR domain-containing protein [Acidobacteriia bacterium]|nr:FecR domain-containing protein [Terriglobia bacterium]